MVLFIALPYRLQEINKERGKEEELLQEKRHNRYKYRAKLEPTVIPSSVSTFNYTNVEFPMINILLDLQPKTLRTYAISAACNRLENLAKACVK